MHAMQRYKMILLQGEQSVCRVKAELHGRYIWNSNWVLQEPIWSKLNYFSFQLCFIFLLSPPVPVCTLALLHSAACCMERLLRNVVTKPLTNIRERNLSQDLFEDFPQIPCRCYPFKTGLLIYLQHFIFFPRLLFAENDPIDPSIFPYVLSPMSGESII